MGALVIDPYASELVAGSTAYGDAQSVDGTKGVLIGSR